jgi:hypothetical protein
VKREARHTQVLHTAGKALRALAQERARRTSEDKKASRTRASIGEHSQQRKEIP